MLFKRGSTISAAEGGCQAEVGGMPALDFRRPTKLMLLLISRVFYGKCWVCSLHGRWAFFLLQDSGGTWYIFLFQRLQRPYFRYVTWNGSFLCLPNS
jgi:hypothetical protein